MKIPVTYVLYPDEGHGFGRPQNSLAEAGFVERFLYKCLRGRYEDFYVGQYNSSAIVISDAENTEDSRYDETIVGLLEERNSTMTFSSDDD
ncbi:unnamed protein product [Anisakis simplex]|uniref:Peptidase S9 prolyl oligopeptidase catalytic domain-containing protein n=1 Tax=Anisakis simplex TaxID=6269 RepID=A0A3P6P3J6_ANISI|nr:unnamed protein product [Anisakis simplex]